MKSGRTKNARIENCPSVAGEGHLVDEASDGLQAVRYAYEHKPDLVLLDIGLPGLNGIAAAHQIRELSPDSKILFVSQESSPEIIRKALALGALGYVLKSDVESELLRAIDAVMESRTYLSSNLRHTLPDCLGDGKAVSSPD